MQGNQFQLTAATKVVKAKAPAAESPIVPLRAGVAGSSGGGVTSAATVAPAILTGSVVLVSHNSSSSTGTSTSTSSSSAGKKIFAVLDRGVLVTCFPSEESEDADEVSDPIKLKDYQVVRDGGSGTDSSRTLVLVDGEQKETNLIFDNEKEASKWFTAFQAHITYRMQLPEEGESAKVLKEFGKAEVRGK
jgi:hypothetical protein